MDIMTIIARKAELFDILNQQEQARQRFNQLEQIRQQRMVELDTAIEQEQLIKQQVVIDPTLIATESIKLPKMEDVINGAVAEQTK